MRVGVEGIEVQVQVEQLQGWIEWRAEPETIRMRVSQGSVGTVIA